jgi:NAD(P)-dependent dehydrogenase (short-subunit alcohol dehydrogenase family)
MLISSTPALVLITLTIPPSPLHHHHSTIIIPITNHYAPCQQITVMSHRVALIFGAGARIGRSVAKDFGAKGFKVALASRSLKAEDSTADELHIPTDCGDTQSIIDAFAKVKSVFGPPNVVVYNAYAHVENSPTDVFEVPLDVFKKNVAVNIFGAYAAAQEAVKAWEGLPQSASPTYIFTGNCANVDPIVPLMDLSVGKSGAAAFVAVAAEAYRSKHYKYVMQEL